MASAGIYGGLRVERVPGGEPLITESRGGATPLKSFLADRTIGRAYGTVCRLSVRLSVRL